MWKRLAALACVSTFALVATGCLAPAPPPQAVRWLVYGDSLSQQSVPYLSQYGSVGNRWYGGSAPCNWDQNLSNENAVFAPQRVLVQFIGNLPACMNGRDPQTGYEQDLFKLVGYWRAHGVPVVMIISPPTLTDEFAWARQAEIDVANMFNIPVGDAGQSVLLNGQFTFFLPCLASETPAMGCGAEVPGQIRVRLPDGIHFATTTYSSGAARFAAAESQF